MCATLCPLVLLLGGALGADPAQVERRDRHNPELIVEAGGRLATCDQLAFTKDGRYLLAVGDDKVVRVWRYADGRLDATGLAPLRWTTWREQRGAIYALAISPDDEGRRVAIGGYGAQGSAVAILDRATGRVEHYAVPESQKVEGQFTDYYAVMEAAFSPDGKRVAFGTGTGAILLWDPPKGDPQPVGRHVPADKGTFNRVRLVRFTDDTHLLSVAQDGTVVRWDLSGARPKREDLPAIKGERVGGLFRVTLSPDGNWLAAATAPTAKGAAIAVRSLDGTKANDINLGKLESARAVAFVPGKGNRLAAAVGTFRHNDDGFVFESDYHVRLYDLSASPPTPGDGPPPQSRVDCLAFHPKGGHLAVAGGDNHEVTLWDLADLKKPASVMRSAGACLWDVGLSADGHYLGFRDRRDPNAADVNRRGLGPWRVFDLERRAWAKQPGDFKPVEQLRTAGGWTVRPDRGDPFTWYAVDRDGNQYRLPLRRAQDDKPRCFAFVPAEGNKPVRLLVGHYWGVSVFELTARGVRRSRLYTGHQGEVMAVAVSRDRRWFVTAGNDQTVAAWSLADWPTQPELGASFKLVEKDKLRVVKVDPLSPASEAGLVEGDEVIEFAFDGAAVKGGAAKWLERLENPVPGKEHWFRVLRDGKKERVLTTLRQRPLWRYFPTRDDSGGGEWVLWMWRTGYYDSSTNGDSYVGWQVNALDPRQAPTFYRAEQFRTVYRKRLIIGALLRTHDVAAALPAEERKLPRRFDRTEPPLAELTLGATRVTRQDVSFTLRATPRDRDPDFALVRAELWVNDYRVRAWEGAALRDWERDGDSLTLKKVALPNDKLRPGDNVVTFQTFNRVGGRYEVVSRVTCERKPAAPRLFFIGVGIDKYPEIKRADGRGTLTKLRGAVNDAKELRAAWEGQVKLYSDKKVTQLLDADAGRDAILGALDKLKGVVGPEDQLILFLAGHGDFLESKRGGEVETTFVFCPLTYDPAKPLATGVSSRELAAKLADLPCRKLVLLDACHSGEAAFNPVRELTPGGQGPIILAACDRDQSSYEDRKVPHGLFTLALLGALGKDFDKAAGSVDGKKNDYLDAAELYHYVVRRLPALLKENDMPENDQVPVCFPAQPPRYPIAARPK